jgi:UDPglucose 6-dehydrogenase
MKIVIEGLWHLGLVTTAGMLELGNEVVCYSSNKDEIVRLNSLDLPLYEKGILKIFKKNIHNKKLRFSYNKKEISTAKIYWYCHDTHINKRDEADTKTLIKNILNRVSELKNCREFIISSQISVGTIKKIEQKIKKNNLNIRVSYIPENLRLGKALDRFLNPDRIILGSRNNQSIKIISKLFRRISKKIFTVKPESAEMIKHSINSFLANSICYINEITRISNSVGADPKEVSFGLKSDERIGYKSYLSPGGPFGGGTLGRDLTFLKKISKTRSIKNPIIENIIKSNIVTKNHLKNFFNKSSNKNQKVLILGLAYTEGTSTLRQSDAINFSYWLKKKKIKLYMHDPIIKKLPKKINSVFANKLYDRLSDTNIFILMYNHNFYKKYQKILFSLAKKKKIYIYDPFFIFERNKNINYI